MPDVNLLLSACKDAEQGLDDDPVQAVVQACPLQKKPVDPSKKDWIRIVLQDQRGVPLPGERYRVTLPDGTVKEGDLDADGAVTLQGFDPGKCKLSLPDIDQQKKGAAPETPPEEALQGGGS
jgi:hypothetical protein